MKTILIAVFLAAAISLPNCKPKQANQAKTADTTAHVSHDSSAKTTGYIPDPVGFINDFTRLYTPQQAITLDSMVRGYEKKTGIEIAIVTIDSNMIGQQDLDSYTLNMANTWSVGKKKENNGILIGIAPHLHRMRIQNSYGIESKLSNQQTKNIIDSVFIPNFKNGDYYNGTKQGVIAIMQQLNHKQ